MTEAEWDRWANEPDPFFVRERAHVLPAGETTPVVQPGRLILFAKLFEGDLRLPCSSLVGEILDLFDLEIEHITLNTMIRLSIFEWAFRLEGTKPSAAAFAATHQATQRPLNSPLGEDMWLSYMCVTIWPHDNMEPLVPTKAYKDQRGATMYRKWFYYDQDPSCGLYSLRTEISYFDHLDYPVVEDCSEGLHEGLI